MTHIDGQRWVATPSGAVTRAILDRRYDEQFLARFASKVDTRNADLDDCDIWTGALSSEGYGNFTVGHHTVRAHRVAFIVRFGAPPEDRPFLDHVHPVCQYRFCVNEFHLQPVDNAENTRRGVGIGASNQRAMRSLALINRDEWAEQRLAA
jgi:hypothetical protein